MNNKRLSEIKYPSIDYPETLLVPENLLNKTIFWQEKIDGSNIGATLNENGELLLRTRKSTPAPQQIYDYLEQLEPCDIQKQLNHPMIVDTFKNLKELLNAATYDNSCVMVIFFELCIIGKSPSKTERYTTNSIKVFDIWNEYKQCYMTCTDVKTLCNLYHIPVVETLKTTNHETLESLYNMNAEMQLYCEEHNIEGVVAKCYGDFFPKPREDRPPDDHKRRYFKVKVDKLKRKKIKSKKDKSPRLPVLDDEDVNSKIFEVKMELGDEDFKDQRKAMPLIGKYVKAEAKTHNKSVPLNLHEMYLECLREVN